MASSVWWKINFAIIINMKIYYNDNNLILLVYCIGTRHISAEIPNHRENMFTDETIHRISFFVRIKMQTLALTNFKKIKVTLFLSLQLHVINIILPKIKQKSGKKALYQMYLYDGNIKLIISN